VEPNNFWNRLPFTSQTADEPVEALVRQFEFWLRYQRGKIALGEGDDTIGDLLPGYFAEVGLVHIEVHQSDRAASVFPPYSTPAQQALLQQDQDWKRSATGPWDREALGRCVRAGGGDAEFFRRLFDELVVKFEKEQQAIAAGNFHAAFGSLCYLVSGRKE
jgi:hypothetical protein